MENELAELIKERDSCKDNVEKNVEVEHQYINFEMLIIAEKIRAIEKDQDASKLLFNHLYFSSLMIE